MPQPPTPHRPLQARRFAGMARLRPRSMLFTLYGDYAYPQGSDLWLGSLVAIGASLGLTEVAVRSAVARLARERWLTVARKSGNRSYYTLSDAGRTLIEEGTRRIYRRQPPVWNGQWCLLTYSIPETQRAHRDRIRRRLAWLGFGPMGGGTYVSPRDVAADVQALIGECGVHRFARVFVARFDGPGRSADLVRQCWDLPAIARRYEAFIRHWRPLYQRDLRLRRAKQLSDIDAFAHRFALTHDFRRFPFIDPDLPEALLPSGWAGRRARTLFQRYHRLLTAAALRFFNSVANL